MNLVTINSQFMYKLFLIFKMAMMLLSYFCLNLLKHIKSENLIDS